MDKTLKSRVYKTLELHPETRDSDITLTTKIWTKYFSHLIRKDQDGEMVIKLKHLNDLPREDHIKRVRADIQNVEKKFLPTTFNIFFKRLKNSKVWRDSLGYTSVWTDEMIEKKAREIYEKYQEKKDTLFPEY